LARVSAVRHVPFARQFLREHCLSGYPQVTSLTGSDVMTFVERHARDHSPQSAKQYPLAQPVLNARVHDAKVSPS
jgi:hypothetical protein